MDSCQPQLIQRFLSRELSEDETEQLEDHLCGCEACQTILEEQTATSQDWTDAVCSLATLPESDAQFRSSELAVHPLLQSIVGLLAATDDPNMLGRLGGYEISGIVGYGGMGAVLKGYDSFLKRVVAIKVLLSHLAASPQAKLRFAREAQAAASIHHDNVISIYSVAEANGLPYLVMPFLRGQTLQKRLDDHHAFTLIEIVRIAKQLAAGLAAAHAQGLVHRDIKPANIMLDDGTESLQITDFGLARAIDQASVTRTGIIAGTPHYMSPEQARGDAIDARSDLFSLGSVLYVLCTASLPFDAETTYGIIRKITDSEPRDLRIMSSSIPAWMEKIIHCLHTKDPARRYQTAQAVADLLEQCETHLEQKGALLPPELRPHRFSPHQLAITAFISIALVAAIVLSGINWKVNTPNSTASELMTDRVIIPAEMQSELPVNRTPETAWDIDSDLAPNRLYWHTQQMNQALEKGL